MKKVRKNPMIALRLLVIACTLVLIVSPMVSTVAAQPYDFPRLPSIGIQHIPDASVRFLSIQKGETHSERYETSPTLIRTIQADPNLELVVAPGVWLCYLQFNTWRVGDKVVRQAIAYANNKDDMINSAMLGWGTKEEGVVSIGWHSDFVSERLLPGGDLNYDYNITIANQLLDNAGYIDTDGDGIREIPPDKQHLFRTGTTFENPEGTGVRKELRFTVRSLGWFPMSHKPTEILVSDIEQIGIKFDLSAEESKVMYPAIFDHMDFDIFTLATSQGPDFSGMFDAFYGPELYSGGDNYCGYDNSHYNDLWSDLYSLPFGTAEHNQVILEMQEMVQEEALWISWYTGDDTHVINSDFAGYTVMPGGLITSMNIWTIIGMVNKADPTKAFNIAYPGPVMHFNPFITTDLRTGWWETVIYDTLLVFDPNMKVVPWLAESYSFSADGMDWSFTIRDNVVWHDGTPLTAEDVMWNFAFRYDHQTAEEWSLIQFIDRDTLRVEGNDVKFSLKEPNAWFLPKVAGVIMVAPHTYPEGQDYLTWNDPHPIGSGPFKYDSHVEGQTWKAVRNPNWWYTGEDPPWPGPEPVAPIVTTIVTTMVPELNGSFLIVPVVMLGFMMFYLLYKRKRK